MSIVPVFMKHRGKVRACKHGEDCTSPEFKRVHGEIRENPDRVKKTIGKFRKDGIFSHSRHDRSLS